MIFPPKESSSQVMVKQFSQLCLADCPCSLRRFWRTSCFRLSDCIVRLQPTWRAKRNLEMSHNLKSRFQELQV